MFFHINLTNIDPSGKLQDQRGLVKQKLNLKSIEIVFMIFELNKSKTKDAMVIGSEGG